MEIWGWIFLFLYYKKNVKLIMKCGGCYIKKQKNQSGGIKNIGQKGRWRNGS